MRWSAKVADVVVDLGHADVKGRIARHAEFFARPRRHPVLGSSQLVFATARHTLHDFGRARAERQCGRQDDTDRFFRAVCQRDAMAHAFPIKVHVSLRGDGRAVDFFGDHGCRVVKRTSS